MSYRKEIYDAALTKITDKKRSAESLAEKRREEVYAKLPRAEEIEAELAKCGVQAARAVLSGEKAVVALAALKENNLALQSELRSLLICGGFPVDYMEPKYSCELCGDTGYCESDNKTVICSCLKNMLVKEEYDRLNAISPLKLCTFNSFRLEYYSMDVENETTSPYSRMTNIFNYCVGYAKSFHKSANSILMRGATGLGKTHLSLAVANEVIKKGFSVIYVSAPAILSKIEKEHFSSFYSSEDSTIKSLTECDLLILDDLGTEFKTQFTVSAVYNIVNTRLLLEKPVIISTNLSLKELESDYTQRFVSRIYGNCTKLDFLGKDIRSIRKNNR